MSPELLTAVQEAVALLESWRGRFVRVEETLTRETGEAWDYDHHGCTPSQLAFVVQHVGWRFSGSALYVLGAVAGCDCDHEVSLDALVAVRRPDDESLAAQGAVRAGGRAGIGVPARCERSGRGRTASRSRVARRK